MQAAYEQWTTDRLVPEVRAFIANRRLISSGDLVVAAVSGGVDSMVMLEVLYQLSREARFSLHVAHFDHMLRGSEGARDAELVRDVASRLDLPFTAARGDVAARMRLERKGLEETGRNLRYEFLFALAKRLGGHKVATAHHADDQAETILLRILRGTGLRGLRGIPAADARGLVRPLLPVRKSDILEFAKRQGITFREDSTNARSICQRNFLRNELLPGLGKERREKLILDLVSLSESAKAAAALLEEKVSDAYRECLVSSRGGAVTLDLKKTRGYHYPVRTGMYRRAFGEVRHGTGELPRRASLLLFHLCEKGRSGMGIDLPGGVRAFRSFDVVTLTRETSGSGDTPSASLPIQPGTDAAFTLGQRTYRVRAWMRDTVDPSVIARAVHSSGGADEVYFDAGALDFPLFLRSWSEGDRISPFGLEGTKKLSDLLRESRVPREMRSSIPLLAESRRILWVVGLRRSSHAAVVPATRRVLEVKVMTESE